MRGAGAGLDPASGAANMALDQALLASVGSGAAPVLRLYRWSPATLSFGRNQPARGLYDTDAAAARGIAFVRRPTGGQAVLHHHELTYVAPVEVVGRPRQAYRRINQALVAGLRRLGLDAEVAGGEDPTPPAPDTGPPSGTRWTDACFRRPERGEVVVRGRKLVGSAQRTERRTILQHGSILSAGTQAPAEELLRDAPAGEAAGWTTLERELGVAPDVEALAGAVVDGFESLFGVPLSATAPEGAETAAARELQDRFASDAWTWRR
jgi:lipoate-protein ligase A